MKVLLLKSLSCPVNNLTHVYLATLDGQIDSERVEELMQQVEVHKSLSCIMYRVTCYLFYSGGVKK